MLHTNNASLRVYIVRHGETDYNLRQIIQGHSEVPLNDTGIAQAACLGHRLREFPIDRIYASDLRRATMTAAIIGAHTGAPIVYEPAFRERNPGVHLNDKSYEEAVDFFTNPDYAPLEGETTHVFGDRIKRAFDQLVLIESHSSPRHVTVVTHGMVCAAFLRVCANQPVELIGATRWPNASLTIADYHDGAWTVDTLGDASHLDDLIHPTHETGA